MKLRCTENSIRLRLRKSDIAELATEGVITETIAFPCSNDLSFELRVAKVKKVEAKFANGVIVVNLPQETGMNWINSNQVGIETEQPLAENAALYILIEKDFPCKDRPEENKADTFEELASEEGAAC